MNTKMKPEDARLVRETAGLCLSDTLLLARHFDSAESAIEYLCEGPPDHQIEQLRQSEAEQKRRTLFEANMRAYRERANQREGLI